MERKIKKAVITCGGYATRFLPVTKAVPKEMLPIVDKPIIHYIMQELVEAGVTDVQIQIGRGREVLMNYFDINYELDDILRKKGSPIQTNFFSGLNISYRRVPMPKGFADAVYHAKQFVGEDFFLLCVCDEIFFDGNPSLELVKDFEKNGLSAMTGFEVPLADTVNYGIIKPVAGATGDAFRVETIVEKPKTNPPSNLCGPGRYLVSPKVFKFIEEDMAKNLPGEICLMSQFNKLCATGEFRAVKTKATRFDTGSAKGFVGANNYAYEQQCKEKIEISLPKSVK